jgi:hypothetical protein
VTRVARLALSVRCWLRLVGCYAVLAALAAPAALGPAMGPVLRELGAQQVHLCKCGMPEGKCGCPACDRLAQERQHEHAPGTIPAFKNHCDEDAPATPFAALPTGVLAPAVAVLPVPMGDRVGRVAFRLRPTLRDPEPPTPPPRIAA